MYCIVKRETIYFQLSGKAEYLEIYRMFSCIRLQICGADPLLQIYRGFTGWRMTVFSFSGLTFLASLR